MQLRLYIDRQGTLTTLYTDDLDLRALGTLKVRRASRVEFNSITQRWEVLPPSGRRVLYEHRSRAKCLAWERRHLKPDLR